MVPITGQPATCALAMKQPSRTPPRIGTSTQEEWLETNTTGRPGAAWANSPITCTRRPSKRLNRAQ